jgi:endonuclease YncB( thermonuclease family)
MHSRLALLVGPLLVSRSAIAQAPTGTPCLVGRIVDGDTLRCADRTKVRLIGGGQPRVGTGEVGPSGLGGALGQAGPRPPW